LHLEIGGTRHEIRQPKLALSLQEGLSQGPFDVAIFALKSFDTRSALEEIKGTKPLFPPILCLQNGVDNEGQLISVLGEGGVIAGTVTSAIGRRGVGDVILERLRGVGIASGHPLSDRLVQEFSRAGLNASLFTSGVSMKWSKMLTNLPANATAAILNMTPAEIFSHKQLFQLERRQLREALMVMRLQGIDVVNLPGTPVKIFEFAIRWLPTTLSRVALQRAIGKGRGAKMPSFHIDLHNQRGKSEVIYLNGAIADYAERLKSSAPVNRFLTETLMALTQGILPLNTYAQNPSKFLNDLASRVL
jgi:2-dehydropantoate 2-reductase